MARIVNVKYRCRGYDFDAAVDCNWQLHCYDEEQNDVTPIELYCFDHPEWDIRMIYHKKRNDQQGAFSNGLLLKSVVDWQEILKETRKWVREMRKK